MRQGNHGRRPRGGRPNRRPGPLKAQTFDSNGPDVRIRGNAHQVYEKYLNLARDATAGGDRVLAESYWQFAEHYYRIIHESTDPESPGSHRPHFRDPRYEDRDGQWDDDDQGGQDQPREQQRDQNRGHQQGRQDGGRDGNRGDGNRNEGGRDGNRQERGDAQANQREGGQRDGNQRDGGQRDGGQRDGGQREGGREQNPRRGRQQAESRDDEDRTAVPVGSALPAARDRARIGYSVAAGSIAEVIGRCPLSETLRAAPEAWREKLQCLVDGMTTAGLIPMSYGSLAWQFVTGLPYLRDTSDIDVAVKEAEAMPLPDPATMFDDTFKELTWMLEEQKAQLLEELEQRP